MAVLDNNGVLRPRTGFPKHVVEAPKAVILPKVEDPTKQYVYGPGNSRAGLLANNRSATFTDIQNGYTVDSYIRQGVSKYAEKIFREGSYLDGENDAAVQYVKTRFDMMTVCSGIYWELPLRQAIRDYVKYGTGFLVKARMTQNANIFGKKQKGMRRTGTGEGNKPPVGAYFAVSPIDMTPVRDPATNRVAKWQHQTTSGTVEFELNDVVSFLYDPDAGSVYGNPFVSAVLDDVRALRQCEEMIIQLIFKSLNPLIHHEVPDSTGTGVGDQKDVNKAASEYNVSAVNGYLVTPPGHKINVLGMESKALRAEGYLDVLKHRVYAGLGLSDTIMGDATTSSAGATEGFSAVMNDRVRFFQRELSDYITYYIIWELLQEGGFDPVMNEKDRVTWKFHEVDIDRRIREEAHNLLLYQGNGISEEEFRGSINRPILPTGSRGTMYLNTVQIPLAQAGSQSEAVSSTGNNGNGTTGGGGSKKGDKTATAGTKTAKNSAGSAFMSKVKSELTTSIGNVFTQGKEVTTDQLLQIVDSCERSVSVLHGQIPITVVEQVRHAVRAAIESTSRSSQPKQLTNTLYGWLNTVVHPQE